MPSAEKIGLLPGWRFRLNVVAGIAFFVWGVGIAVSDTRYIVVAAGAVAGMLTIWVLRGRVVRSINFAIAGALGGLLVDRLLPLPLTVKALLDYDPYMGLWTGLFLGLGPGLALQAWATWRAGRDAAPVNTQE